MISPQVPFQVISHLEALRGQCKSLESTTLSRQYERDHEWRTHLHTRMRGCEVSEAVRFWRGVRMQCFGRVELERWAARNGKCAFPTTASQVQGLVRVTYATKLLTSATKLPTYSWCPAWISLPSWQFEKGGSALPRLPRKFCRWKSLWAWLTSFLHSLCSAITQLDLVQHLEAAHGYIMHAHLRQGGNSKFQHACAQPCLSTEQYQPVYVHSAPSHIRINMLLLTIHDLVTTFSILFFLWTPQEADAAIIDWNLIHNIAAAKDILHFHLDFFRQSSYSDLAKL